MYQFIIEKNFVYICCILRPQTHPVQGLLTH